VERIFLDQLAIGREGTSTRRTVTEADIVAFCGLSGDFDPLHTDELFVQEQPALRGRTAHDLLVLAISSGLRSEMNDWHVISRLGVQRRSHLPVYPGDTLHVRWRISSIQPSRSRPGVGVVRLTVEVVNQDGEVVQEGTDELLVGGPDTGEAEAEQTEP
jgi:3-hydroxybutyryl-CoA dehydratase